MSTSGMESAILGTPLYFERGIDLCADVGNGLPIPNRIIVAGMGGSAFPADLLTLAENLACPIIVNRDYTLNVPNLGPDDLVIACSFSGNTEETLSAFAAAGRAHTQRIAISAGGALQAAAKTDGIPHIQMERPTPDFQPRAATAYFLGVLGALLENIGLLKAGRDQMRAVGHALKTDKTVKQRVARLIAAIGTRIPVIYAPAPFAQSLARIIKIKLNENSKLPAFFNQIPEFNHNEMVGFTQRADLFSVIILQDPDASQRMQHRINTTVATLLDAGLAVHKEELVGSTNLIKAFRLLYAFDFASCELAHQAGIDPNPVEMIEDFKRRLG